MPRRYAISREFFPFDRFAPPMSRTFVRLAQWGMKEPRFFRRDPALTVTTHRIPVEGGTIPVDMIAPKDLAGAAPCLVCFHGGGFVFRASDSHYRHAMTYAREARCRVAFVHYRLAPGHPFPVPQQDACAALCWVHDHAAELAVDPQRIAVGGDSAGGTLAVVSCMMARDCGHAVHPACQLLIYPWLDGRNDSESCRRFTDTPMWNARLSEKVGPIINPHPGNVPLPYRSPVEAASHAEAPPTYIEVAEYDCLHDDGVLYAALLREAGVPVELHEVPGAMHGFDTVVKAPTTQRMLARRIAFLRKALHASDEAGENVRKVRE